jgi:hypothetical protein
VDVSGSTNTGASAVFTPINIIAIVILAAALVWRVYQTQRAPRQLPTWAVTLTIVCVALAYVCQQTPVAGALGMAGARLVDNALLSAGLCSLLTFFLSSAAGRGRRAAAELVPLAVAIVLMVVALAVSPPDQRGASLGPQTVHVAGVALFYLVAGLYLIYGLVACVIWINRYQRRTTDQRLRTGLRLSGFGLACGAGGSVLRAVYLVVAWPGGPTLAVLLDIGAVLVVIGSLCFIAGICWPGVLARLAALRRRRQHSRAYRQLSPLWTSLVDAYPTIVLRGAPSGKWDALRPRTVHRRYYRRVIEIRDGLVQLSPYLETDLTTLAGDNPKEAAESLTTALRRQAAGEAADHRAHLVLPGGAGDIDADVRPLLALSRAMRD